MASSIAALSASLATTSIAGAGKRSGGGVAARGLTARSAVIGAPVAAQKSVSVGRKGAVGMTVFAGNPRGNSGGSRR
jgi:hypothetical protein